MTSHTYTMQLTAVVLTAGLCASACVANGAVAEPGHAARIFDVRDFGACGDGVAKDTAAIQKAIDAAAERGGTVRLGAGTYLSGSLYLKSNVEFFLDPRDQHDNVERSKHAVVDEMRFGLKIRLGMQLP